MTGRYVTALRNGRKCRVRDPEVLERDILALLTARGPMPQRQIAAALNAKDRTLEGALAALRQAGEVESYRAIGARRRMDVFWCIKGQAPTPEGVRFGGVKTLGAMQRAAANKVTFSTRVKS